jgi:hypothetical protein
VGPGFLSRSKAYEVNNSSLSSKSLRMRGDIPLLPLYDFMAWAGTNLILGFYI